MEEIAILMAAGIGSRMRPLTNTVPKPLVRVHEKPMIETIIEGLEKRNITHIYVVVGYKKEQFQFLTKKYKNLTLIENREYLSKNNISSIYAVSHVMGNENCFICEADLYIEDDSIFQRNLSNSGYYGKMVKGYSDDWIFELDEKGKIIHIGQGGYDAYNMCGICYLMKNDAKKIADAIKDTYKKTEYDQLFWDEIVNQKLDDIELIVYPIKAEQIVEIDTVHELAVVDPDYQIYDRTANR